MQAEMNKLFAEGGVMQQGGTVDPVSGNEVPPGAMAEEVRDDIDAKLSEGEFVIPADVVRYIGLEKLMMMRDKAKAGLARMNEIGQMGNAEEVPDAEALHSEGDDEMDDEAFSSEIDSIMSEDDTREFAKGGYVAPTSAQLSGGNQTDSAATAEYSSEANKKMYASAPIKGFEMVAMTNDAGQTIYIPFINGKPQLSVPPGYKVKTAEAVTPAPTTPATDGGAPTGDGGGGGGDGGAPTGGGNTDGTAAGGGQGISNAAISAGLAAMSFGQSTLGKAVSAIMGVPLSTAANIGGTAVVDAQIDAIGKSFDAMSNAQNSNIAGQVATVSDESGNISTVSNQSITDAFDMATFGVTSQGLSDAAASNTTQAAETGMTTNAQGQTVSNDASIAAQDAANFGSDPSQSMGPDGSVSESSADSTAADNSGVGGWAKGGFVSRSNKKAVTKQKGLASRKK
jgi:hypothetical protein